MYVGWILNDKSKNCNPADLSYIWHSEGVQIISLEVLIVTEYLFTVSFLVIPWFRYWYSINDAFTERQNKGRGKIIAHLITIWDFLIHIWSSFCSMLTLWGRVTHICVSKLTIIGSDNGLSPDRRQAIIWTNAGLLLIGPLGTDFSEILIEILTFSFKKMHLKVSSAKRRPFCLGLNMLILFHDPVTHFFTER